MIELTQGQLQILWFLAKLSLPVLLGWIADRTLRKSNPKLRVVAWRTVAVALTITLVATCLPPLNRLPITWHEPTNVAELTNADANSRAKLMPTFTNEPREFEPLVALPVASIATSPPDYESTNAFADQSDLTESAIPAAASSVLRTPRLSNTPVAAGSVKPGNFFTQSFWWVYGSVIAFWLLREAFASFLAHRLVMRSGDPVESQIENVKLIAGKLGIAPVPIRVSSQIQSPCVLKLLRPTILLPESLASEDSKSAIAHELAHVASRDLAWDALIRLVRCVLWPHPLVWKMVGAHRAGCESVSDLVAANVLDDRVTYRASLARIALHLQSVSARAARRELRASTLPMARRAEIVDRLRIIASDIEAHPISRRARYLAALMITGFVIMGTSSLVFVSRQAEAQPPTNNAPRATSEETLSKPRSIEPKLGTFNVQAIADDAGTELAGAKFDLMICTTTCRWQTVTADEHGVMSLELAPGAEQYSISGQIYSPGRVPGRFSVDNVRRDAAPLSLTVRMKRGIVASGIVVDEAGKPIAGASIRGTVFADPVAYSIFSQTTGDDGRWVMDSVEENTSVSVEHDDYVNDSFRILDGVESVTRLAHGRHVQILVLDPAGKPVPGAQVEFDPSGTGIVQSMMTDRQGRYRKNGLPDKPLAIQVCADGFAPIVHQVPDSNHGEEIEIRLREGYKFELLVVDEAKRPIPDVYINVFSDGRFRRLWDGRTDVSGVATWNGATGNVERISIGAKGFARIDRSVDTSQALEIELRKAPTLRGKVVDAATGEKIETFSVRVVRIEYPDHPIGSDAELTGHQGTFELPLTYELEKLAVVINAPGYQPWQAALDVTPLDEFDVRLERADALAGSVVDPMGRPASSAMVVLTDSTLMMPFPIRGFHMTREKHSFRPLEVESDADGKFRFDVSGELPETCVVFIEHDSGFAHVQLSDLDSTHQVRLEPWTSLEVTASRDGKPISGLSVNINYVDYGNRDGKVRPRSHTRVTDATGRAFFNKVRPWDVTVVTKPVDTVSRPQGYSIEGLAEQTKRVQLLSTPNRVLLERNGVRLDAQIVVPLDPQGLREPAFTGGGSGGSIDGLTLDGESKRFLIKPDQTGRIVVDSIPPGNYHLHVAVTTKTPVGHSGIGLRFSEIDQEFAVPADAADPLQIDFACQWPRIAIAGDDAEPFVGKLANGKILSSKDVAGKWLLLDWFSPNSELYREQLPKLVSAYPHWNQQGLQIISFAADWHASGPFNGNLIFEAQGDWQQLPWPVVADHVTDLPIRQAYGVGSTPTRFLINPAGKIVYRGSDWNSLANAINSSLKQSVSATANGHFAGLRSQAIDDSAFVATTDAAVAVIEGQSVKLNASTLNRQDRSRALKLFSEDGKLLRAIELDSGPRDPRRGKCVIDQSRKRVYVVTNSELLAISRQGEKLFRVRMPDLHAVTVDETSGEVWCCCGNYHNGWTIVLNEHGNEIRRMPIISLGIICSPADQGAWLLDQRLRLIDHSGNVIRQPEKVPSWIFAFDALVDERGQLWIIGLDHPLGQEGSRTALWRVSGGQPEVVGHYSAIARKDGVTLPTELCVSGIELVAGEILVSAFTRPDGIQGKPVRHVDRLSLDGESLGSVDIELGNFAVSDSGVWSIRENELQRFSLQYKLLSSVKIGESTEDSEQGQKWLEEVFAF